jgi:hypothetical protein
MAIILDGNIGVTYPDVTTQNTSAVVNGKLPDAKLPAGSVLQVVNSNFSTRTAYSSPSGFQDTGVTATITPKYATSKILVLATIQIYQNVTSAQNNVGVSLQLLRGATVLMRNAGAYGALYQYISVDSASGSREQAIAPSIILLDSPATTSATTYKIQGQTGNAGTLAFQDDSTTSAITLMEIAG